jgi:hypothetical protein
MSHGQVTNFPHDPILDLDPWVGQRQANFRFQLINGITGEQKGDIHPIRTASLSHDTSRTIKRQLSIDLGVADTVTVNPLTDRILVYMVFPSGVEYPLGQYMFTDVSRATWTSGQLGSMVLNDEMFLVDQQIEEGINGVGANMSSLIVEVLDGLPVTFQIEVSPFSSAEAWTIGTSRGQILEALAVSGDYFSPWFGNDGNLHFIRTFDPASKMPDFDWDVGNKVIRNSVIETDDLLTAPNRIIVVSNAADDPSEKVVATADIPSTAPNSIANRGFVIPEVLNLQLSNQAQASAVASGIAQRMTVFERTGITTAPDPRHDSYNVIQWQGEKWLELAWTLPLVEGAAMSHLLRKAYGQ